MEDFTMHRVTFEDRNNSISPRDTERNERLIAIDMHTSKSKRKSNNIPKTPINSGNMRKLAMGLGQFESNDSVKSTHSDVDITRVEMKWNQSVEELLEEWIDQCEKSSSDHGRKARKNKLLYQLFGLPGTILPMILGGIQDHIPTQIILSMILMLIGIINGTAMFFNFSKKSILHFDFEAKFADLALNIRTILTKDKRYRQPADLVMAEAMLNLSHLKGTAPP